MEPLASADFSHLIGRQVGSARIIKELARGAMAVVFIAFQTTLKRQIALKVLPKAYLTPETAARFQQEAETAAILSHPNIIPVYEVGETDDFLFFTMQLVDGKPVSYYMEKARKNILPSRRILPLQMTLSVISQLLDALDYAHQQGIIHRDIKPANILIETHTKRPIITDFGIAKVVAHDNKKDKFIQGTPNYMSPEQILNQPIDGRADIYAVGTTLFEMLVPELPLPKTDSVIELLRLKAKPDTHFFMNYPSDLNTKLDTFMDRIVLKALEYAPQDRYSSCHEFLDDIRTYQQQYM